MHRIVRTAGAISGVVALSALAAGPAVAAAPVSQATAQSLDVTIAGNNAVSQIVTATNDGSGQQKNDASTVPSLANLLPGNNATQAGVAPQDAGANSDGTSYACAGLAGTGGGIASVGNSSCNISGSPVTLDLADVDLGSQLLGPGAITDALNNAPGLSDILTTLGVNLDKLVSQLTTALNIPIKLPLSLSTIEGVCTADPTSAQGSATLADAKLSLDIDGTDTNLVTLPANPPPNTKLTDLQTVTQTITDALNAELSKALGGAASPLSGLTTTLQEQVLNQLSSALKPVTDAVQQYLADVTLNEQTKSDGGKKIDVKAIDAKVVPNSALPGGSLISGVVGHVTCGPNGKVAAPTPTPTQPAQPAPAPHHAKPAKLPLHVDSGLPGNSHGQGVGEAVLAAFAALFALTGTAGTLAYRRFRMPRG